MRGFVQFIVVIDVGVGVGLRDAEVKLERVSQRPMERYSYNPSEKQRSKSNGEINHRTVLPASSWEGDGSASAVVDP